MSIQEMIEAGEGKNLEFKQILPGSEKLAKSIIAFANMSGGKIIIGITDHKEVVGIDAGGIPEEMDRISNIVHDCIRPVLAPDLYVQAMGEKTLLVINVPASQMKPHYLKSEGKADGTYIRVGATNKQADAEYIQELERQRLNIGFDEDWFREDEGEIDKLDLLAVLSGNLHKPVLEKDLLNLKLCKMDQEQCRFTNAAAILLGSFEHVRIKCARFKGDDARVFIDRKEYDGNLFDQIERTMQFLQNHINLHGEVGPDHIRRIDRYEIPTDALREAILNAVVHRDYSMRGSDIKVAVFDSRIEITSPGGFPKGITVDEIIGGRSEIRNRIVARIFHETGAIEQWGRGVQLIFGLCREAGLAVPKLAEAGMFVKLTLYRSVDAKVDETQKVDAKVDETQKVDAKVDGREQIQAYPYGLTTWFEGHKSITTREAMDLFGISKSGTNKRLKELVDNKLLVLVGDGKSSRYVSRTSGAE